MPFNLEDLRKAMHELARFMATTRSPNHERYIFPFFKGSYFAYRKVDVLRTVAVAKAISVNPSYVDIGCGYGDFLEKVRQFLPEARGIEKDRSIFYAIQISKPDYINLMPVEELCESVDVAFVGW